MSLAEKQKLLNFLSEYAKSQEKFLSVLVTFNPEPQIIDCTGQFANLPEFKLSRVIKWQELRSNFYETNPLFSHDFVNTLDSVLENISLENLHEYLNPDFRLDGELLAFKIEEVSWYIHLWSKRWGFAPPYSPKRLFGGLKIILTSDRLTVCTQDISQAIWSTYEVNPIKVVPLTKANFEKVLEFHSKLSLLTLPKETK